MGDFESWDVSDLSTQLKSKGFSEASECFSKHEIEGEVLPFINDDHLKEIGMTNVGERLKVLKWIKTVTASYSPPIPEYSSTPTKTPPKPATAVSKARPSAPPSSSNTPMRSSVGSSGGSAPKAAAKPKTANKKVPYGDRTGDNVPKCKRDHDKMVEQIRAARKYMAYQKALEEGRAVGPPPELPPIEEPPDLVQCPNCGRKFGPEQAKRHIPVCERMNSGRNRRW